jgi:hypothetical protein
VSAAPPATITVAGGEVGRSPIRHGDLPPGVHVVGARFDTGGETRKKVRVGVGEPTVIVMEPPASATAAAQRSGLRLAPSIAGVTAGLGDHLGGGVSPEFALNAGLTRMMDVRFGARVILAQTDIGFLAVAGAPISARFNFGSTFSMGLGSFIGLRSGVSHRDENNERERELGVVAGPEAYPAIFRMGPKRQVELGLHFGYLFNLTSSSQYDSYEVIHFGINFAYLVL